jgi:glycosyltransferase involved in cell wall biosynthesis
MRTAPQMKILHFILGKASKDRANGVNQVVAGLAKYSARAGAHVRVIGKTHSVAAAGEMLPRDGFDAEVFPGWGRPLRERLQEGIAWADVVHLHGGYSPWNILVGHMCDAQRTPYIVTLHNVLSPELTEARGTIRKAIFHRLFQRPHLQRAAALHVLTEEESTDVLGSVRARKVFCIPNGVDLDDFPHREPLPCSSSQMSIGYLGRLSSEKNLEALCTAVAAIRDGTDVCLKLAGPVSEYGEGLRVRYGDTGVQLVGPVYADAKVAFMDLIDLLVIPSLSEGFSVAATEALAMQKPLLITRTSKMSHYFDRQAFFMCEPSAFGLERGLRRALAARGNWKAMTRNGRRLVDERLNWGVIASQMLASYESITRGAA